MRFSFNAVVKFETTLPRTVVVSLLAPIIVAALRAELHELLLHSLATWI